MTDGNTFDQHFGARKPGREDQLKNSHGVRFRIGLGVGRSRGCGRPPEAAIADSRTSPCARK
jgi:hypothetical protein